MNKADYYKLEKVYDKRKKLFGIKIQGKRGWYVEPQFEEYGRNIINSDSSQQFVWFKKNGKYGLYDIKNRLVAIAADYTYPLYFNSQGYAITWQDYKAGVIDIKGDIMIPFIYDEISERWQIVPVPEEERRTITRLNGEVIHIGPKCRSVFHGYACFTNEGAAQAYDEKFQPEQFQEWEKDRLNATPEYGNSGVDGMSISELEELIRQEYVKLIESGYGSPLIWSFSKEQRSSIAEQEERVKSLIRDRRIKMNSTWVHNIDNAKRISRTNDLLMSAVKKAVKLGKKTAQSLQWMESVGKTETYVIKAYVHPKWQDSKSEWCYKQNFESQRKEKERLVNEESELSDTHIWNIIAAMCEGSKYGGYGACFETWTDTYAPEYWDLNMLIGDDGQTWDEHLHFPAYQDVYFTKPFHYLFSFVYDYSFEDLCNINDFRVNIDVKLETREIDARS